MSAADATKVIEEEEVPSLESVDAAAAMDARAAGKTQKRYAKAMAKLGLVPEPNILRITVKKHGSVSFGFSNPEVYRFPTTNTFVFFGEFQVDDLNVDAQKAAARAVGAAAPAAKKDAAPAAADEKEEDATGLNDKEISMVMNQASVTRNQAIKALRNNNGDIVNAIMELTM